jgi:hypothetical protein
MNENPTAEGDRTARLARTVVASLFVAGAAAVLVLRPMPDPSQVADSAPPAFLHTPAADLTVPSAEQVFASQARGEEEPLPTF